MSPDAWEPSDTGADAPRGARRPADAGRDADCGEADGPGPDGRGSVRVGGREAARKFVGRLARLDRDQVRAAIEAWRRTIHEQQDAFFAAEEAVERAVAAAGCQQEQRALLGHVADAVREHVWQGARGRRPGAARPAAPDARAQTTEASGQYVATVAVLALLVRDRLDAAAFELLYRPFAPLIALDDLGRE